MTSCCYSNNWKRNFTLKCEVTSVFIWYLSALHSTKHFDSLEMKMSVNTYATVHRKRTYASKHKVLWIHLDWSEPMASENKSKRKYAGNIALHMRKVKHTAFSYSDKQERKHGTTAKGYNFYQLYKHCKHIVCTAVELQMLPLHTWQQTTHDTSIESGLILSPNVRPRLQDASCWLRSQTACYILHLNRMFTNSRTLP